MAENKLQPAAYCLPFKHPNSNFWDKKTSSINVDSYNRFLLDVIRIKEKQREILEVNKEKMEARQKEKTDLYWKRLYETKYTSAYEPCDNGDLTLSDRDEVRLRSMGFDV